MKLTSGRTNSKLSLKPKSSKIKAKEGVLTMYSQAVNHLLETHAPNDVIGEADIDILHLMEPANMTPLLFGEGLRMKKGDVILVYNEYVLKERSFKGLSRPIGHNKRAFLSIHEDTTQQKPVFEGTSLLTL